MFVLQAAADAALRAAQDITAAVAAEFGERAEADEGAVTTAPDAPVHKVCNELHNFLLMLMYSRCLTMSYFWRSALDLSIHGGPPD